MSALPELPAIVQRSVALAGYATVRTGGSAELFARPEAASQVVDLLAWAAATATPVAVIGSGSNLLIADSGVAGLVLKLGRNLAAISFDGEQAICGGAARLPAVAAKAARAGLAGIEFGVSIPGTVGGAIRMNAGAYGGEMAEVLAWAQVACADGLSRREPKQLGFGYRHSQLKPGVEIVTEAAFALSPAGPELMSERMVQMRSSRRQAQPAGIKTFGSTFKNPDDERAEGRSAGQLLSEAGCNGLSVGGARFAPKHANFVENTGSATTADVLNLMGEGRSRVLERFGVALEPEVQLLGDLRFPW